MILSGKLLYITFREIVLVLRKKNQQMKVSELFLTLVNFLVDYNELFKKHCILNSNSSNEERK